MFENKVSIKVKSKRLGDQHKHSIKKFSLDLKHTHPKSSSILLKKNLYEGRLRTFLKSPSVTTSGCLPNFTRYGVSSSSMWYITFVSSMLVCSTTPTEKAVLLHFQGNASINTKSHGRFQPISARHSSISETTLH